MNVLNEEKDFEKKQEVIDAAINEFGDKGYESASLNTILREAGISKGSFYYHFKNKEGLYIFLVKMLAEEKKKFFAAHIDPADFENKDIFSLFHILSKTGLEFARHNPYINKFSQSFIKDHDSDIYQKVIKTMDFQANDYLHDLIENAYEKNELREDLPKEFTKRIMTYLFTHIQDVASISKVDDFETAANHLIEFLKNGLSRK
ncbi:TetR/AcrR family transcriptional regulator [Bacillus marinisedimentorum]|uniref:TetR/AcrR family transcriptional regulator n=1 Tax=Bacillus marinisedimentorum TaxID=1821260 RepID=UPI0007E10CCC|nr:TetR/AcrR family transcriptional regulator [Bacillus marinisedimentorum]